MSKTMTHVASVGGGGHAGGGRDASMMDAAKLAVARAQKRRHAVEAMRRTLLQSPMPRPYHKLHCPAGALTAKGFAREFANRVSQLPEVGPPRRMAVDRRGAEPPPWYPHGHGENVDVAEPKVQQRGDQDKGSYNARCDRYLTLDYARTEAPLPSAAMAGDLAGIRFAVAAGRAVDAVDGRGNSAMALAALHGQHAAVELLVECGARLDGADAKGWTAAHGAAAGRHPEVLMALFRLGAPLDAPDRSGSTPMHYAARHNDLACLRVLLVLAHGSVTVRSGNGMTPLHQAALANSHEAVTLLGGVGEPALLEAADAGGETALHRAARCAQGGADAYATLLRLGADAHACNGAGETPQQLWRDAAASSLSHDEAARGLCHYSGDAPPGFAPQLGGALEGRLRRPGGVGAADVVYPNGPGAYGQPCRALSNHVAQRDKKALRNELHAMALVARRAQSFAAREAAMEMGARAEVAAAMGQERQLMAAARLDIAVRRDTQRVAQRELREKRARQAAKAEKAERKERERRAAARRARKREGRAQKKAEPKGFAALLPAAARERVAAKAAGAGGEG